MPFLMNLALPPAKPLRSPLEIESYDLLSLGINLDLLPLEAPGNACIHS